MNNYAYVFLIINSEYLPGLITTIINLKDTNTPYDIVCLLDEKLSQDDNLLKILNFLSVKIKFIPQNYLSSLTVYFKKFYIETLTEYDKVVYLDSDLWIIKNIDELFNYPHGSGTLDLNARINYYDHQFLINGGLYVLEPKKLNSFEIIKEFYKTPKEKVINYHDQIVLTNLVNYLNTTELHIPFYYNVFATWVEAILNNWMFFNENLIKIYHFAANHPYGINVNEKPCYPKKYAIEYYKNDQNNKFYQLYMKYCDMVENNIKTLKDLGFYHKDLHLAGEAYE